MNEGKPVSKGIVNGLAVSLPKPAYPAAAQAIRAGGAVNVQVVIDEEGNVVSASAVSGHPLLRQASVTAARSAKFKPSTLKGKAVKVSGVIVYQFVLPKKDDDSEEAEEMGFTSDRVDETPRLFKAKEDAVLNGSAIDLPRPAYPPAARAVKASGTVNVQVLIDEAGNVVKADAISGHPLLRAAAVNAASLAKFKPTLLDGNPVKVNGIIVYNFVP